MLNITAVFIGGGIGAVIRYIAGLLLKNINVCSFPLATFTVNVAGSFIIGFLGAYFLAKPELNPAVKLLLTVGFCGGLTTFSTFSAENINFLASGKYFLFFFYILASLLICFSAAALGAYCANKI